ELKALGLKPYEAGRPKDGQVGNLVVDLPGKGPRILLNAHVDTVGPGKNIKPVERDGFIFASGKTILGADDKSGVAAILEVLRTLKQKKLAHPALRVIFTVAEEIGLLGALALPKRILSGDFCITLDHGNVAEIIYKAPSQQNIIATVKGKSAHAGIHPEHGINAIKIAAEAIARMKFGRIDKETTSNIGVIKGGKATNVVPDRVEIRGEARSHDPKKLQKQIDHMRQVFTRTCAKRGAKLKFEVGEMYKSFEIKKSAAVIRIAVSAVKASGIKPVLKQTGGGSDANIFNAAGIPTVIMGTGMQHVHTTAERLSIKNLTKGAEVVLNLIVERAQ
ncbi:MAG: M20/M25/M40 family metallo-hydrolase, partial [Candidatus Margulisiibacteriota bacterium]